LRFGDGLGTCDEHLQGDALGIEERYNSKQLAGVRVLTVEIFELRCKCGCNGFVLVVG
jgi:hypothetical protein